MKKNNKKLYIIEGVILLFIIIYRFVVIKEFSSYANYINILFWMFLGTALIIIGGFPKDKNYLKKNSIRIVLITLLIYLLLSNLLGLFTGFYKTVYSHKLLAMLNNILPVVLYVILLEIDRYLILRRGVNKTHLGLIAILFILHNLNLSIGTLPNIENGETVFLLLSLVVVPIISRELLFTYMTYNVSYVPSLIYHVIMDTYVMIFPILPNLGNYLSSVFMIFLPYVTYRQIKKSITYKEKYASYAKKLIIKIVSFIMLVFIGILVILVSGIFKYKMIAIASNSMNPIYYRGDAVIYEKVEPNMVHEGDILVFQIDNVLVTHRVISIIENNGNYKYITKGDNNDSPDNLDVSNKNVVGIVKYVVKYIAFPSVWFSDYTEEVKL